jgi:hypothetical protein
MRHLVDAGEIPPMLAKKLIRATLDIARLIIIGTHAANLLRLKSKAREIKSTLHWNKT